MRFASGVCVPCTFRLRRCWMPALPSAPLQQPKGKNGMADSREDRFVIGVGASSELASSLEGISTHPDPIGCDFNLPLKAVFYPLGFAVEISTNCPEVLAAAEQNWKSFDKAYSAPPVQVRIAVIEGQGAHCPPPPNCRGQRN